MANLIKKQKLLLEDALEEFLTDCKYRALRVPTIALYEKSCKLFIKYLLDEYKIVYLDDVKKEHISEYVKFTFERGKYTYTTSSLQVQKSNNPGARGDFGKKITSKTVDAYLRNIKTFFNWCHDNKLMKKRISQNIKNLTVSRKPKDEITTEEFNKIIERLDLTLFTEYRDYVLMHLLFDTGLRITECLNVTLEDIDLKNRSIFISAEVSKGKRDRFVFFGNKTATLLQRWIAYKDRYYGSDLLFISKFGRKTSGNTINSNFRKYVKRARIDKQITPHCFRNNFARRYLMSGGDIFTLSKILGHSSVTITEKAYLDLNTDDIRKSYLKHSPIENMKRRY